MVLSAMGMCWVVEVKHVDFCILKFYLVQGTSWQVILGQCQLVHDLLTMWLWTLLYCWSSHNPTCCCFPQREEEGHHIGHFPQKLSRIQRKMWILVLQVGHCFGVTSPYSLIHHHTPKCLRSTDAPFPERYSSGKCVPENNLQACPLSDVYSFKGNSGTIFSAP